MGKNFKMVAVFLRWCSASLPAAGLTPRHSCMPTHSSGFGFTNAPARPNAGSWAPWAVAQQTSWATLSTVWQWNPFTEGIEANYYTCKAHQSLLMGPAVLPHPCPSTHALSQSICTACGICDAAVSMGSHQHFHSAKHEFTDSMSLCSRTKWENDRQYPQCEASPIFEEQKSPKRRMISS